MLFAGIQNRNIPNVPVNSGETDMHSDRSRAGEEASDPEKRKHFIWGGGGTSASVENLLLAQT